MAKTPRCLKSVTLLEVLVAIVLMGIVVLGLSSIEVFSRYHMLSSDRRAKLQNEASLAIDHITKHVARAVGTVQDPPIESYTDNKGIRIRTNASGLPNPPGNNFDPNRPEDVWIAYRHENIEVNPPDSEIRFYPNAGNTKNPAGGFEVIARKIRRTDLSEGTSQWGVVFYWPPNTNYLEVTIRSCWFPSGQPQACGTPDNPGVTATANIQMPGVSVN